MITPEISEGSASEYLDELAFLAETAGADPVKSFLQRVDACQSAHICKQGQDRRDSGVHRRQRSHPRHL
ncbi:MAG: hypothetical protein MZV63_43950 [Marinilabiliales bacterium]|nr:hypothetical protein [Marinilabiliales bacterium]